MPCNAVARADAKISNETLLRMLTPDVLKTLLANFARETFKKEITVHTNGGPPLFYAGGYRVWVQPGGNVHVEHSDRASADALSQQLKTYLERAAGVLVQAKAAAVLRERYEIERVQRGSEGAIVLQMEVR